MRHVRAWWSMGPEPGNFGDVLTPPILRAFGYDPVWTSRDQADLLCVGSIARFSLPGQVVLGSGIMWEHEWLNPGARYLAVRGPRTVAAIVQAGGVAPSSLGDPALLLPMFHKDPLKKTHDLGVVPHYVDFDRVAREFPGHQLIHPLRADPLEVVDDIRRCRSIVSSSLHGVIVAHAYGIPAAWCRFSDGLDGDDVKFRDYAESVGVDLVPYLSIEEAVPVLPNPRAFDWGLLTDAFYRLETLLK